MAFFLFQFAFADTCSTITSGAMVGRTGFKGDLLYSFCVSGFIYPILGHWVWGPGGWLQDRARRRLFRDFAGSTVVHTMGGMIALAGAIVLGPRLGRKFKRDGGGMPPGHDLTLAALGGVILWFGWYGFNPGSTLSAIDAAGIGRVATNTTLAAAAGGLGRDALRLSTARRSGTWASRSTASSAASSASRRPCYWVNTTGAVIIGTVAGVIVVLGVDLIEHLRIDDPIGAVAVHGVCGIWGTWAVGLFATGQFGVEGLFWGGGGKQLWAQIWGNATIGGAAFIVAFVDLQGDRCVRLAAGVRRGRARGPRHPRARRARLPPGARIHGAGGQLTAVTSGFGDRGNGS